jgi:hypothetical protein
VTVRIVEDQVRIYYRGSLIRSHERRHHKEKEEGSGATIDSRRTGMSSRTMSNVW